MPYDIGQLNPLDTSSNRYVQLPRDQSLLTAPTDIDTRYLGVTWSHQFNDKCSVRQQFAHDYNRYGLPQWLGLDYANFPDVFGQSGSTWTVARGLYPLAAQQTVDASILDLTGHFETAGVRHTLLVGADYYRMSSDGRSGASSTFVVTDAFKPTPVTGLTLDPTLSSDSRQKWQNFSVYAQDQLHLPGRVEVLAGLRYQKVTETSRFQAGEGNPFVVGDPQDDHAVTPRLGVLWLAREDLSFYGNYAENFGANTGRNVSGAPLDPETAKQYEVGMKSQFMDGTLTSTLALFNLTKQNVATADPANPGFNLATGEVRSRGVEFDIQGEVAKGWNTIATYAYTDIVITKSNNGDQGLGMMNVPRKMGSLSTTYKFQQPVMRRWKIGGGVYWRDATPDATNTLMTPARAVINAMAAYAFEAGRHKATFQLNVDNLFDKRYVIDAQQFGNAELYTNGSPRTVTAVVRLEL